MPQRSEGKLFQPKKLHPCQKIGNIFGHEHRIYYHRSLRTQLFRTDSRPKVNFVDIFPDRLYFANSCCHHVDKIYSQKGEREKSGE